MALRGRGPSSVFTPTNCTFWVWAELSTRVEWSVLRSLRTEEALIEKPECSWLSLLPLGAGWAPRPGRCLLSPGVCAERAVKVSEQTCLSGSRAWEVSLAPPCVSVSRAGLPAGP